MQKFYVTCAIPYVNAAPHVGHALELVQGDTVARYQKLLGNEVLLLSGGDENALKNVQAAEIAGQPVQTFVDQNTKKFYKLTKALNCQFDIWQKGSDQLHHFPSSQALWQACAANGDIYKKNYQGLYCVGCEIFYAPDELNVNGECFEHPGKKLQIVSEENYFFRLSKYQKQLVELISSDKLKIMPDFRKNEVLSFLKQPLQDISISRSNERAKNWGVPVPADPTQRIYVWFDALNIYQSGVGFGWDEKLYKKWWPAELHIIGKGILRFHAVYWPAFLLSAKLSVPKSIFAHGYFTVNSQKMSKTLGNVIDPFALIEKYGADPLRYYLLSKFSPFHDGDFSDEEFKRTYNADLANGLGNLVSRVAAMAKNLTLKTTQPKTEITKCPSLVRFAMSYEFDKSLEIIWQSIRDCDKVINDRKVWELPEGEKIDILSNLVSQIVNIGYQLQPFLPQTAEKIIAQFENTQISSQPPLFPRLT